MAATGAPQPLPAFSVPTDTVSLPKGGVGAATQAIEVTIEPELEQSANPEISGESLAQSDQPETSGDTLLAGFRRAVRSIKGTLGTELRMPQPEKIAASMRANFPEARNSGTVEEKYFLSNGRPSLTATPLSLGTDVAHARVAMPAALPTRLKSSTVVEALAQVTVTLDAPPARIGSELPVVPPAALRETLVAVVTAIETLAHRAETVQKSVDLHFDIGRERLGLRVELRDGTVHTTFRAESAELRTALAHEWQAVVPPAISRELRLADPVFTAPAPGGETASSSTGHGAPQQRNQPAPEPAAFSLSSDPGTAPAADSVPATPVAAASSVNLLQAFA